MLLIIVDEQRKLTSPNVKLNVVNKVDDLYNNSNNNNNRNGDPPPLPPKPKVLPIKQSNWGQNLRPKQGLYLEQPTSSFV